MGKRYGGSSSFVNKKMKGMALERPFCLIRLSVLCDGVLVGCELKKVLRLQRSAT